MAHEGVTVTEEMFACDVCEAEIVAGTDYRYSATHRDNWDLCSNCWIKEPDWNKDKYKLISPIGQMRQDMECMKKDVKGLKQVVAGVSEDYRCARVDSNDVVDDLDLLKVDFREVRFNLAAIDSAMKDMMTTVENNEAHEHLKIGMSEMQKSLTALQGELNLRSMTNAKELADFRRERREETVTLQSARNEDLQSIERKIEPLASKEQLSLLQKEINEEVNRMESDLKKTLQKDFAKQLLEFKSGLQMDVEKEIAALKERTHRLESVPVVPIVAPETVAKLESEVRMLHASHAKLEDVLRETQSELLKATLSVNDDRPGSGDKDSGYASSEPSCVATISDAAREVFVADFNEIDESQKGFISCTQIGALLKKQMGKEPTPEEIESVISSVNRQRDGTVSSDEYLLWICGHSGLV